MRITSKKARSPICIYKTSHVLVTVRGGIVQSVLCNCNHFLFYCGPNLSSNHSRFSHQSCLLWLQQTPSSEAETNWAKNMSHLTWNPRTSMRRLWAAFDSFTGSSLSAARRADVTGSTLPPYIRGSQTAKRAPWGARVVCMRDIYFERNMGAR
jgi:hypothetical protein